ncbi:hypothetical protein QE407_003618 [Pantoea dispersa]|nr:hypothetical protein [Pantoea dispersa]
MARQAEKAGRMPSFENTFRNLHLNQRVSTVSPFISRSVWESCGAEPLNTPRKWYAGLDLSARNDLTALVIAGEADDGVWDVFPFFWTPEKTLEERTRTDRAPYDVWVREGLLRTTPGASVDYAFVVNDIAEIIGDFDITSMAFDRWRIDQFRKDADAIGLSLPLVEFGQGFKDMGPAVDTLESLMLNGRVRHGMHPVLTMCAVNAVIVKDAAGTVAGAPYTLVASSVTSDTQLTLAVAFDGPTTSGLAWSAVPASLQVAITQKILNDFAQVARGRILDFQNWQKIYSDEPFVTVTRPDRTEFTGPSWGHIAKLVDTVEDPLKNLVPLSRQYMTLAAAQADIANIPAGSTTFIRSQGANALADEYINNGGTLVSTGKQMPSLTSMLFGITSGWRSNPTYPFTSLSAPNENTVNLHADSAAATTYREALATLSVKPLSGDVITVRYRLSGSGAVPRIGLKASANGAVVSNMVTLVRSDNYQEVQLTATDATATLLFVSVNTSTATDVALEIISWVTEKNAITRYLLELQDAQTSLGDKVRIGAIDKWQNNATYPWPQVTLSNENMVGVHADASDTQSYKELNGYLNASPAQGETVTVRYKLTSSGAILPSIGLKSGPTGSFVSNQVALSVSDGYQDVSLTTTAATATVLAVAANTRFTVDFTLEIIVIRSARNGLTTQLLESMDRQSLADSRIKIGAVNLWNNSKSYPYTTFSQVNDNHINYGNTAGAYSEMSADIAIASGASVVLNYALNLTSGRLFARLANGSTWTGPEVQLSGGGARQQVILTATADSKQIKLYTRAEVTAGQIVAQVNAGQSNALTEQLDAVYASIASANSLLAILSQESTFDSFVKASTYTYKLTDAGNAYKQLLNTVSSKSGISSVKMVYKITSAASLKIQTRNGNSWGGNETALTADGNYHEVDLAIASGTSFTGWGIYSNAKAGGYTADVLMVPVSADGVFFTPATAILYNLMMSSGSTSTQNTDVIFPAYFYAVDGRPLHFYGANMVSGARPWRNNTDVVLASHGQNGKTSLIKSALPDATILPSEINGPTLDVCARSDTSANVYRKKATFTKLSGTQSGNVRVACMMDSLGERCIPWLYFALNSTGATYVGAGSRTTRGLSDTGGILDSTPATGIPFDGRGGWTTFDYIGKTQKTNFTQPFLRDAVAADFAAYPQYCYDKAYSGQSYADNPNLTAYQIFDISNWMTLAGVASTDKLVVVLQLGYNDLYYDYTPSQTVAAQEFIIAKYREKIPDTRFVISNQAFGWSGISKPQNWQGFALWITQKIRQFDNRISEKIIIAPAWSQMSYKYGTNETAGATSDTGVQTVALSDDVHPGELQGAQWGDALLAPVLAAWQL